MDKTFAELLNDGRGAIDRALDELIDARSSFWCASVESRIEANQILLEQIVDLLSRQVRDLDFEQNKLPNETRSIADNICFALDESETTETDYRITTQTEVTA